MQESQIIADVFRIEIIQVETCLPKIQNVK